jgi:hypothetical protein
MQFEPSGSSVEPYPSERLHHLWNGLFLKPKNIDVKITQPTLFARRESNGDVPELLSKMAARKDLLIQRLKRCNRFRLSAYALNKPASCCSRSEMVNNNLRSILPRAFREFHERLSDSPGLCSLLSAQQREHESHRGWHCVR